MTRQKSKKAGFTKTRNFNGVAYRGHAVYEALERLRCEWCGNVIEVGELFTRPQGAGFGNRRVPHCHRCNHIELEPS
jgi:NAD-dependent SIR2 family protein deacetylase